MRNSSKGVRSGNTHSSFNKVQSNAANKVSSRTKQLNKMSQSNQKQKNILLPSLVTSHSKTIQRPTNIPNPKNVAKKIESKRQAIVPKYLRKKEQIKECKWGFIPYSFLIKITGYSCKNLFELHKISQVCSVWRGHMMADSGSYFWNELPGGAKVETFAELKQALKKLIVSEQQKMSFEYEKHFIKLFNYGSTKENIPNKLIQKLNLELEVTLNKKTFTQPFKLRTFNFSSYLCTKIEQIKQYKYDFYTPHNIFKDSVTICMNFKSLRYKVQYKIERKYLPEDLADGAIKQKAFNYYLDKNFVFTYFEGDDHFLYIFFEISLLQLVNIFRSIIKNKHKQSLNKKTKKLPLYKQLCQTEFESFEQYLKYQADFQIHFSYHNSLKQIFTHCDTKVYPVQYNNTHAFFDIKIDDSFQKCATYKLDNKMGISESIENLFLLDFVFKDRDKFIVIFSGFLYARKATQKQREQIDNYFDFNDNEIKILESKQQKFMISFTIIQQVKRNLMKNVKFTLFA